MLERREMADPSIATLGTTLRGVSGYVDGANGWYKVSAQLVGLWALAF